MEKIIENNRVMLIGEIMSGFSYSHESYGERFYMTFVKTDRKSDESDIIPVIISERLLDVTADYTGEKIAVSGQFRSYNKHEDQKTHLVLYVFAREVEFVDEIAEGVRNNRIFLTGFVCKEPRYRVTHSGREIADLLLAVNRPYGRSDYIPCIVWGRGARFTNQLPVGTSVKLEGRIQSREYMKRREDGTQEYKTAYEVSVSRIDTVEMEEEQCE